MKFSSIALTAATASVALAQPHVHKHQHQHQHLHDLKERDVTQTSWAPGPTAYIYMLNGKEISAEEVCEGLQEKELKFVDGHDPGVCAYLSTSEASTSTETSTEAPPSTSTWSSAADQVSSQPAEFFQAPNSFSHPSWPSASPSAAAPSSGSGAPSSGSGAPSSSSNSDGSSSWAPPAQSSSAPSVPSGGTGIDAPFPDGQLDCSQFPSDYGALAVNYLGMAGWSGLQAVTIANGFVNHIVTGVSGQGCTDGMMCSYACPPGYQKSQWPSTQGSTGQSVGGLSCSGGKLYLTNSGLSNKLCIKGVGGVQATNSASGVVAICRTDYPGTEAETVPVELQPGSTQELTVPDAGSYYVWQGKSTSAQYYLNPIGVSAAQGCQWGTPGTPVGNFAPINFGIGAKDGVTWLSIFQNSPTTNAQYQGTVELTGNLSGTCKYSNGQYCGVTGCNSQGCTVRSPSDSVDPMLTYRIGLDHFGYCHLCHL